MLIEWPDNKLNLWKALQADALLSNRTVTECLIETVHRGIWSSANGLNIWYHAVQEMIGDPYHNQEKDAEKEAQRPNEEPAK